jgi:hypothetical protein
MVSSYLSGGDLAAFGVPNATATQVQAASGIVDGFLQRPAGCVYDPVAGQMLNTGAPLAETPHGRRVLVSYTPLALVLSITYRCGGVVQNVPWTYGFSPDGFIYPETFTSEPEWRFDKPRHLLVTYLAGWTYATLPSAIKQATANILLAQQQVPTPAFSMMKAGDTQFTRASKSLLDADTQAMIAPYKRHFAW